MSPDQFGQAAFDWEYKHAGHNTEFLSPKRFIPRGFDDRIFENRGEVPWWFCCHNSDIKVAYAADAAFTLDLSGTSCQFNVGCRP